MSRGIQVFLFVAILVTGCRQEQANVKYSLSDEQLSRLMFDIQLSDIAVAEMTGAARDTLSELFWLRLTEVYKRTKPELAEEIRKLEADPEKMKLIMDQVQVLSDSIR